MRVASTGRGPQRGITLIGLLSAATIVVLAAVLVMQLVPTYIEYLAIDRAVNVVKDSGSTVSEIRDAFDRQAAIDDYTAVRGKDLDITKENDKVVISFAYDKEIHLFGPLYLLMKYKGQSK